MIRKSRVQEEIEGSLMIHRCRVAIKNVATLVAVGMIAIFTMAIVAPTAEAHDSVINSVPADGGHVDEFPEVIDMTFSGVPKPNFNTVAVTHEQSGKVVFSGEPELDGQHVLVRVPKDTETPEGTYVVGFQITSSDGHATRGKISFDVGKASESSSPETTSSDDNQSSTNRMLIAGVAVLVVLAVGVIIFLIRKGKKND